MSRPDGGTAPIGGPTIPAARIGPDALAALRSTRTAGGLGGSWVASVHNSGALLLLESGAIVALVVPNTSLHPWAIAVPLEPGAIQTRARVRVTEGLLLVGQLAIELAPARIVSLELAGRLEPDRLDLVARKLALRLGNLEPPASVALASYRFAKDGSPESLDALVGLGPGLTPSGDDVLMGLLAGLELTAGAVPASGSLREWIVRRLVSTAGERTTRLSAQLLRAAAGGRYPEPVLGFASALAAGSKADEWGEPDALSVATGSLLAMGHESGWASLTGIVLGVAPEIFAARAGRCTQSDKGHECADAHFSRAGIQE